MEYAEFKQRVLQAGASEVLVRDWNPNEIVDEHTHPFAASALVVRGEMWLTARGNTRHLRPGDTFELESDEVHAERYGPEGATYWVGRR